jgi:hypothetical protein
LNRVIGIESIWISELLLPIAYIKIKFSFSRLVFATVFHN